MGSGAATARHGWPIEFQVALVHPPLIAVHLFCVKQVEDERDGNPQGGPVLVMLEFVWPAQDV